MRLITRTAFAILSFAVSASVLDAAVRTETISYTHNGKPYQGFLTWDDALEGKRPGVLVVHEWWGLNEHARERAKSLAELGYVAFALDMYGEGKVTEHPAEARQMATEVRQSVADWRARAKAGLEILRARPEVDSTKVAAMGFCFGGSTAIQLAYAGEDLKGVVSFHGALPILEESEGKNIKAKFLICHGASDPFIPEPVTQQFRAALEKAGADWRMIYYSGAQHSFTNQSAHQAGVEGLKYHEDADRHSWLDMREFFQEVFGEE